MKKSIVVRIVFVCIGHVYDESQYQKQQKGF